MTVWRSPSRVWLLLAALIGLAALVVWLAPLERTLGTGIKTVYVHVALVWTGMTLLSLYGVLGVVGWMWARESVWRWSQAVGWIGLLFFVGGLAMSMLAAVVNWGGIFLAEPRYQAMLRVIAVTVIVLVVNGWPVPRWLKGLLSLVPAGLLVWSVWYTPLVLHPQDPVRRSDSVGIRLAFFVLFGLSMLTALLLVQLFRQGTAVIEQR